MSYLLLIDVEQVDPDFQQIWNETGFVERLISAGRSVALWDPNLKFTKNRLPTFREYKSLLVFARENRISTLVCVLGNQCFVDVNVMNEGLKKMNRAGADYFTQWEHCRLPAGIGIRAFSLTPLEHLAVSSPSDAVHTILTRPHDFKILHDDQPYVSYEQSLQESRFTVDHYSDINLTNGLYGLEGFISISKSSGVCAREGAVHFGQIDERGISAAYGFESNACAQFPTYIMFDITNKCNSRCIHCPQSFGFDEGGKGSVHLDLELYKKVIDECRDRTIQFIRLTADGEPFLHPRLFEMIDYATSQGVGPVGLTTNGSFLNASKAERLVESGLFMVDISLDAIKKETYEKIRCGLSFEKTMKNVAYLLDYRNRTGSNLKVMVSFVKQEKNNNEMDEFRHYWTPLVDKVLLRELITNVNLVDVKQSDLNEYPQRWPCPHWFRRIVINYEGMIKVCPIDWENKTVHTSVAETTLHRAWHSDFFWKNRMEHLNNNISANSLCHKCSDWIHSPWALGYEKVVGNLE